MGMMTDEELARLAPAQCTRLREPRRLNIDIFRVQ